jgi:hypothetical protein
MTYTVKITLENGRTIEVSGDTSDATLNLLSNALNKVYTLRTA